MINEKTKKEGKQIVTYIPDFLGEEYLFYTLPKLTVALLRATTADEDGNLTYEKECMPCEPLDLAMAAKAAVLLSLPRWSGWPPQGPWTPGM